ncbi:hypothetical protein GGI12_003452 [Dipsacomyces acuminosporus]|nr:hypothetical protein GGI12_003452 [Dipsacomyces acuminosporus]
MRKPSPGMWHLAELDNGGLSVDRSSSFFVGDAAGRKAGWKRGAAADFSDSDLAFALNLNVPFYTPEHIFIKGVLDKDTPLPLPPAEALPISRFVPAKSSFDSKAHEQVLEALSAKTSRAPGENKRLLVMLVGPPASGKSTFAIRTLEPRGFVRINMDALKTKKKCENAVREALSADKHVVVDNTNPDPSTRRPYLDIAKELGAERICVAFEHGSRNLAIHNNRFRSMLAQAQYLTDHKHERSLHGVPAVADRIPDVAYNTYFKKFAPPTASEGFSDILQHAFVPSFESPADERIWYQYF